MTDQRIRIYRLGEHPKDGQGIEVSCGVLDIMDGTSVRYRIVTDCGLAARGPNPGAPWTGPDLRLLSDGHPVDAVRLTHAHLDHCGFAPALMPYMAPDARVFATKMTAAMLGPVLRDGFDINRRRRTRPPYTKDEMHALLNRVTPIMKPGRIDYLPGISDWIHPAGHIPGACSFTTRLGADGAKRHVHYSGDRCEHDQPGILGATPVPAAWMRNLVIACGDCTYGAEQAGERRNWWSEMQRLTTAVTETIRGGHPALVCTFGIQRGGAILQEFLAAGVQRHGPVHLDGACRGFTRIAQDDRCAWHSDREEPLDIPPFALEQAAIAAHAERETIAAKGGGYAVIGPPGMGGPGGIATFWRKYVLEDPGAMIAFTGFVAPGTDAENILRAAALRQPGGSIDATFTETNQLGRTHDVTYALRCKVIQVRLGAHQSRAETVAWYRDLQPLAAVLNHGSRAALDSLETELSGAIPALYRSDTRPLAEIDL